MEKLLQLLSNADVNDDAKTENVSLKSVAEMLYRQHEDTDSGQNDAEDSRDVSDDTDSSAAVTSSAANVCVSSSHSRFPLSLTTSAEASHNTAVDGSCSADRCMPHSVNSVEIPSQNVQHLQAVCVPTTSLETPFFCIPMLPVMSPSGEGQRRLYEQIDNTRRPSTSCGGSEQTVNGSPGILLTNAHNIHAVMSTSSPNVQSLYSYTASPSVPCSSYSDFSYMLPPTFCSSISSSTLTTTSEAMSRIAELLTAQCRVLVLMRGCPGSGKTTMARYACACACVCVCFVNIM